MALTSETLFHYNKSLKNLQDVLSQKFKLSYCEEVIEFSGEKIKNYIPMVTFCDIPLAMAKDHIKKYGSYAIGLSKDWGGVKN